MAALDEGRRNSLTLNAGQLSPCELSQTESTEALQNLTVKQDDGSSKKKEKSAEVVVKPPRKLIPVVNPVIPEGTSRKSTSLPAQTPTVAAKITTNSASAKDSQNKMKKRPSYKRPAPPPPVTVSFEPVTAINVKTTTESKNENNEISVKDAENECPVGESQNISDDDEHILDSKSDASTSLMTEIFAYLNSNNTTATPEVPDLPHDEEDGATLLENESALPYDENYVMPGVKSSEVMQVSRVETEQETGSMTSEQRTIYEMFYAEMLEDNSRLTLGKESSGSETDRDSHASSSDEERQGSYDVTACETAYEQESESPDEDTGVILKHFASTNELDSTNSESLPSQFEEAAITVRGDGKDRSLSNDDKYSGTSSTGNESDVATKTDYETTEETDGTETSSLGRVIHSNPNTSGAYFNYRSLISPPAYYKGVVGAKGGLRKPPLPPKPVFH